MSKLVVFRGRRSSKSGLGSVLTVLITTPRGVRAEFTVVPVDGAVVTMTECVVKVTDDAFPHQQSPQQLSFGAS